MCTGHSTRSPMSSWTSVLSPSARFQSIRETFFALCTIQLPFYVACNWYCWNMCWMQSDQFTFTKEETGKLLAEQGFTYINGKRAAIESVSRRINSSLSENLFFLQDDHRRRSRRMLVIVGTLAKVKAGQGMRMFSKVHNPGKCLLHNIHIMAMVDVGLLWLKVLWKDLWLFLVQAMDMGLLRHLVMPCHLNMYGQPILVGAWTRMYGHSRP